MTQLPYALLHPDPDAAEFHLTHNRDLVPTNWTGVWATVRASLADFAVRDLVNFAAASAWINGNRIAIHPFDGMMFQRFASARVSPRAVLLLVALAFAPSEVTAQSDDDLAKKVTVVGCVQREKNYQKEHRRVDSGPFALGFGVDKKYMLINATWIEANTPRPEKDSCSRETWGRVFELTDGEGKVKPFIGQWVEITGTRKRAGGSKMFEIDVDSVRTYVPPVARRSP